MGLALGIDLGGTKTEAAVLDADGQVVWRERVPTPAGDYAATLHAVAGLVQRADAARGTVDHVGVGHPGCLAADGRIKNANSTCLNGQPLQADLERLLARPLRLANDANCLALSEATDGAAAGADVVFAVILGTGVGGGIAVHGRVLAGANGLAGEWGHNPCPGPMTPKSVAHPPATAGSGAAWKPGSAARASPVTMAPQVSPSNASPKPPQPGTRQPGPRWTVTQAAWPARWQGSSTCWTPTSSCSPAGSRGCLG